MKIPSNTLLEFLTLGFIVYQSFWLTYAVADSPDSQVVVAQYEWEDVQYHILLEDLESSIDKLPRNRSDDFKSRERRGEYLQEFLDEKLKILDAISRNLDTDATLLKSVEEYQQRRMVQRLIEMEVDEKISYTDLELEAYYAAHKEDYRAKAESHATCISLTSNRRAQEVLDEIINGRDIEELAVELSRNGELRGPGDIESDPGNTRLFAQTDYPRWRKFVDAVFALEIGEMTRDVFEIEVSNVTYFMIFRKDAYIPERQMSYDEVRDEIEQRVEDRKKRSRFAQWMSAARENARFDIYSDRLPDLSALSGSASKEGDIDGDGTDTLSIAEFECDGRQFITLAEVKDEFNGLPDFARKKYKDKSGLEEYINLMAESRLMLCLAKERKIDEDARIVQEVKDYQHDRLIEKITELEIDQKLQLTEDDYRRFYEQHKADYFQPEKVRLICLTLRSEEFAERVFQRIREGEDMIEIATELSDRGELTVGPGSNPKKPGDTGFFTHASYVERAEAFADAAFALEVGEMVKEVFPIEVEGEQFYLIFRKEEYREARQPELEEDWLRSRVENDAERRKRQSLTEEWLTRLRERANVKTFPDRIPE
ncbi:MAG: peptidyl-prolyl cis-trans isomerase [Candidatus Poribacteria bacterium]|nr:peptidyl-prolyl cis-trans isomerase [Candidatus Poribacteria bacterium]